MKRFFLLFVLLLAGPLCAQQRIQDLDNLNAVDIADDSAVLFGTDKTDVPDSFKISLAQLKLTASVSVVDDVADLATAPAKDGQLWMTRGYTTAGIGWNVYRYVAGSSATVDGGWVLTGPGGIGRYLALDKSIARVSQFGAIPDNATDATAAIEAAVAACPEGGTVLLDLEGQYLVSTTIALNKGITLAGVGRGHEGATTVGSALRWGGGTSDIMLHVNTGTGATVHGWSIRDLTIDGNDVAGTIGVVLGAGNLGTPRAAVGTMDRVWIRNCADGGLVCRTAQLCRFDFLHVYNCGDGIRFENGTNYSNTTCDFNSVRTTLCTVGLRIDYLVSAQFNQCTFETSDDEGILITNSASSICRDVVFREPFLEGNIQVSPGTGKAQVKATNAGSATKLRVMIENPRFVLTPTSDFDMDLSGGEIVVLYPDSDNGSVIRDNATIATYVTIDTFEAPATKPWTVSGGAASTVFGILKYISATGTGTTPQVDTYFANSETLGFVLATRQRAGFTWFQDSDIDATTKTGRLATAHYTTAEEPVGIAVVQNTSGANNVMLGGGSSLVNAASQISLYAAANTTTTTGTEILRATTGGIDVITGTLRFGTATQIRAGTGSPETVITAPVGSLFLRTDGGAGTSLYVKESEPGTQGGSPSK